MNSLRKKIGQLLVMGFDGTYINEMSPIAQWLANEGLGGVLLFDKDLKNNLQIKNLESKSQIKELLNQLNYYSQQSCSSDSLPLLTAIDYEGGAVDRLKNIEGCPRTMPANQLVQLPLANIKNYLNNCAYSLKELGFNLNFAPVVDLNLNDQEGIIGTLGRSFASTAEEVTRMASLFVDVFTEHGIACSYKHFPGHGSAVGDTHEGFVDVTSTFQADELTPYYQLFKEKDLPVMVMTAHVINKNLDHSGLPATLSHTILTKLLREQIGFNGVIISDDLQMQAIAHHYSMKEALALTLNAGADMIIYGNQLGTVSAPEVIDCIEQLVLEQTVALERIEQAYQRVVRLKQQVHCRASVEQCM